MHEHLLPESISVATLNMLHPPLDAERRFEMFLKQARESSPDVLLLQEAVFHPTEMQSEQITTIAAELGMTVAVAVPSKPQREGAYRDGTAILTKFPVVDYGVTPAPERTGSASSWAHLTAPGGRSVIVISMHGEWGGHLVNRRCDQMYEMEIFASHMAKTEANTEPIIILGGDLNAEPDEDSIRYLTGKASWRKSGAYWVDAWAMTGEGPGITSTPRIKAARKVAEQVGIRHPEANPDRRIDYIFSRGWVYGRPGMPISTELCFTEADDDGITASDHYGLISRIWCPPLEEQHPA